MFALITGTFPTSLKLEDLWRRYTGVDPRLESNFLADGGDSFKVSYLIESTQMSFIDILY